MKAYCLLRQDPWYRRQVFVDGLKACGHEVLLRRPDAMSKDTILLIWNRYAAVHELALQAERAGATVIVAENGYLGYEGVSPKFDVHPQGPKPGSFYSLSLGWHNGRGRWHVGEWNRFPALGVTIKPWRTKEGYQLVCPNRSFGVGEQLMHPDWAARKESSLRKAGFLVKVRVHPGNNQPRNPLSADLEGASGVHIWSSSSGVHALLEGIPVFCDAPYWIMKEAAANSKPQVDRHVAFERLAWAQWTCEEIASGEPFRHLLSATR